LRRIERIAETRTSAILLHSLRWRWTGVALQEGKPIASLQRKGARYCQFIFRGTRHPFTVGKVEESGLGLAREGSYDFIA
jgi:hypothetical protein